MPTCILQFICVTLNLLKKTNLTSRFHPTVNNEANSLSILCAASQNPGSNH